MLGPALDIPVIIIALSSERGSLVQHLIIIADTVDNDVPPLLNYILGEYSVEVIGESRRLIKGDVMFEKGRFDELMVDNPPVDGLCQQVRCFSRKLAHRHLVLKLAPKCWNCVLELHVGIRYWEPGYPAFSQISHLFV